MLIVQLHVWGTFLDVSPGGCSGLQGIRGSWAVPRADQQGQKGGSYLLCQAVSSLEQMSIALKSSESIEFWYKYATLTWNNSMWQRGS